MINQGTHFEMELPKSEIPTQHKDLAADHKRTKRAVVRVREECVHMREKS